MRTCKRIRKAFVTIKLPHDNSGSKIVFTPTHSCQSISRLDRFWTNIRRKYSARCLAKFFPAESLHFFELLEPSTKPSLSVFQILQYVNQNRHLFGRLSSFENLLHRPKKDASTLRYERPNKSCECVPNENRCCHHKFDSTYADTRTSCSSTIYSVHNESVTNF